MPAPKEASKAMQLPAKQPPPAAPATVGLQSPPPAPANAGCWRLVKEEKEELSPTSPAEEQLPTKQPPMAHAVSLTPTPSGLTFSDSESEVAAVSGCDQDSTADEEGPLPGDVEDWGDPQRAPILQPSEGERRPAPARAGIGNREVLEPFLERDDVGKYAVYQGNWGGHKSMVAVNEHILYDLVVNCKCQVVCAQEVDKQFIDKMHDPHSAPTKAGKKKTWLR